MKRSMMNKSGGNNKNPMLKQKLIRLTAILAVALAIVCAAGPTQAATIAGGYAHSLGVKSDTSVVAWGYNYWGQCKVPVDLGGVVAVAAGSNHSLALKFDGSVVAWGYNAYGQCNVPADLGGLVAVAAGSYHSLALKSDGSVVAWGSNACGQCKVPVDLGGVVAVAAGSNHSLALKSDGSVVAWGCNWWDQCDVPADLGGVVAVAAGSNHSLALKSDGSVVAWGYNYWGQCKVPVDLGGVVAVAAGSYHSLALKSDGSVVAWGWNAYGQCNVPAGTFMVPETDDPRVEVDIKPGSCPNPLNIKSQGVLPVAILGTADFDASGINVSSILLEGVPPIRESIEDVSTPVSDRQGECDCTTEGPDNFDDLTLKFDVRAIVATLGAVNDGDARLLTLRGELLDGTPIWGQDCVKILKKGKDGDGETNVVYDMGTYEASGSGGGCFIATAAYGSCMSKEVRVLEKVRDDYLLTNELGRVFVSGYYKYSPPLADWAAKNPVMRKIVRIGLYPVLEVSKWFVGENPSE